MSKQMSETLRLMLEAEHKDDYHMRVLTSDGWNRAYGRPGMCYMHGPVEKTKCVYHDTDHVYLCDVVTSECHGL